MSLSITKYPDKVVNDNPATISKWNAVHHAILYCFERKDFLVSTTKPGGDNPSLVVFITSSFTPPLSNIFAIGDEVYLELTTGESGTFPITAIGANTITINIGTITTLVGIGYINLLTRENYFIKVNIWEVDVNNQYNLIGTSINKPDNTGRVKADASSFLKSLVGYTDDFLFNVLNQKDLQLGNRYNITYSENWIGFEGDFSVMSSIVLRYMVNAAKQIQDLYGENMGEYVPFNNYAAEDIRAKFLSDFNSPTYFPGFPFSLSFIYSESLFGTQTHKKEEHFDVNGNSTALTSKLLDTGESPYVNRLMIDQDYGNDKCVDVWLENNGVSDPVEWSVDYDVDNDYAGDGDVMPPVDDSQVDDQQTQTS